ncbi:L,D-transpeptidase [Bdellovibrio svalbardensis]|uniref:L,D-transpeptidase n=1 Tax=Bdellovibrio svalbardensis TaxID=2972972 RepID=A0ABT6DFS6_9BACT|nr:L,D-transpeptidase [Bdellovibrio svalbardensis]MDG0815695.1 L,D-transpeptidase [Bdellovibrio svalbardensis]
MRALILSFFLFIAASSSLAEDGLNGSPQLDDLMTPDELAAEVGAPRTEMNRPVISPEAIAANDGIDVFREYAIVIEVNKAAFGYGAQQMTVSENGVTTAVWPVSTGREQYERAKSGRWYWTVTPAGTFSPYQLIRDHYSQTWEAHMEYAAFFNGGIAIHATTPDHYKQLGTRASGGCVRLHKDNAKIIYGKILAQGQRLVPLFNMNGRVARDVNGNPIRVMGWNTLIIVRDGLY